VRRKFIACMPNPVRAGLLFVGLVSVLVVAQLGGCTFPGLGPGNGASSMTEETAAAILSSQEDAVSLLIQLNEAGDPQALSKVLGLLDGDPMVSETAILKDGTIWARYRCGLEAEILPGVDAADILPSGSAVPPAGFLTTQNGSLRLPEAGPRREDGIRTALLLLPFFSGADTAAQEVQYLLGSRGFVVHGPFTGAEVTIELMETMCTHEVIYITTHGTPRSLLTGQIAGTDHDLAAEWNRHRDCIGIAWPHNSIIPRYTIKASFIRSFQYPGSLVFANACSTLADGDASELAAAFIESGASVYFGWDDLAYIEEWCTGQATKGIFENLSVPGTTVSTAYRAATITPYGIGTPRKYSVDDLYPVRVYKNDNGNGKCRVCYYDLGEFNLCGGDPGDVTIDHDVDFRYVGERAGDFILVPSSPATTGRIYVACPDSNAILRSDLEGLNVENLGNLGGLLAAPQDVAVDNQAGRLYVVDSSLVSRPGSH